jgi:hypothetical protein
MSGVAKTTVYAESLGNALWEYSSINKEAWGNFSASGVTSNKLEPIDLKFIHVFFSKRLTNEQNNKIIENLASILKSIDAVDISAKVVDVTEVAQQIEASYSILQVPPEKVNSLTTTIANVCQGLIETLSTTLPDEELLNNVKNAKPSATKTETEKPLINKKSYGFINDAIINLCEQIINQLKAIR